MFLLGERLKQAREAKGLTQIDCAKAVGASQAAYSYYESDLRTPSVTVLMRIANLLDVSVDWLLGKDEK